MRLALIALRNVSNVNAFDETFELRLNANTPSTVYMRLVDLDRPLTINLGGAVGYSPYTNPQAANPGNGYTRFIPATGSSMIVNLNQIDSNNVVQKVGAQPFSADDRSIWSIQILATDKVSFNNMQAVLTMSGVDYPLSIISSVVSDTSGSGQFFC
jgi:hypothetical protein